MNDYKGLLIGRNPINTCTGNGKTLATFFDKIKPESLSQIYVTDLFLDPNLCGRALRISETKILKKCFSRSVDATTLPSQHNGSDGKDCKGSFLKKLAINVMRAKLGVTVRNIIWKKRKWITPSLMNWINAETYDYIFYDLGNMYFEYSAVCDLVEKLNVPLIIYISDDYILNTSRNNKRKREFKKLAEKSALIVVISEAMKKKYSSFVDANYFVAMNGCDGNYQFKDKPAETSALISYVGNIGIGRYDILKQLDFALAEIKKNAVINVNMHIYSAFEIPSSKKKNIEKNGITRCMGSVFGKDLYAAWDNSDVLLHVESFKKKYRNILSTAVSTKIPEYLISGKRLLIVAPSYSESANIVCRTNSGTVINTLQRNLLKKALLDFFNETESSVLQKKTNAVEFARNYLTKDAVSSNFYEEIIRICKESKR